MCDFDQETDPLDAGHETGTVLNHPDEKSSLVMIVKSEPEEYFEETENQHEFEIPSDLTFKEENQVELKVFTGEIEHENYVCQEDQTLKLKSEIEEPDVNDQIQSLPNFEETIKIKLENEEILLHTHIAISKLYVVN